MLGAAHVQQLAAWACQVQEQQLGVRSPGSCAVAMAACSRQTGRCVAWIHKHQDSYLQGVHDWWGRQVPLSLTLLRVSQPHARLFTCCVCVSVGHGGLPCGWDKQHAWLVQHVERKAALLPCLPVLWGKGVCVHTLG
jgi:hypothetical protein